MFNKFLKGFFTLLAIGGMLFVFYKVSAGDMWRLYDKYFPCSRSIPYTIGSFDEHFGVSKENFLKDIEEASAIWEKPLGRELFMYKADNTSSGSIKINLVYDSRQEATNQIKTLSESSTGTRASYDALSAKHDTLEREFLNLKKVYDQKVASLKKEQNKYQQKVDYWNSKGGAPQETYDQIEKERVALNQEISEMHTLEADLSKRADDINALVPKINSLARELNLNVAELNNINKTRGEEFIEGEYIENKDVREIDVYEFSSKERLVTVLAHELGHSLGLDHVSDKDAIMYYLNQNKSGALTADDLNAIKTHCNIR